MLVGAFKMYNKNSFAMSFTFNAVNLQAVTINGKPYTRAKELCKALE